MYTLLMVRPMPIQDAFNDSRYAPLSSVLHRCGIIRIVGDIIP